MKSTKKIKWIYLLHGVLFLHLFKVFLAITYLDSTIANGKLGPINNVVSQLSKSSWSFGFFSSEVGMNNVANFELRSANTTRQLSEKDGFDFFADNINNRIRYYGFKHRMQLDTLSEELISLSIAAKMMDAFPETEEVYFSLEKSSFPNLETYARKAEVKYSEPYFAISIHR